MYSTVQAGSEDAPNRRARDGRPQSVGQADLDGVVDKAFQRIGIERLSQDPQIRRCGLRGVAVARRQYHRQIGILRTDFARQPDAVDRSRHDDIAENKIDLRALGQQLQCRFGRLAIERIVAEVLEQRRGHLARLPRCHRR